MSDATPLLSIHAVLEVPAGVLSGMVETARQGAPPGTRAAIDTAERLNRLISKFLLEKDFEAYVRNPANHAGL
jgi:hypothetical protein